MLDGIMDMLQPDSMKWIIKFHKTWSFWVSLFGWLFLPLVKLGLGLAWAKPGQPRYSVGRPEPSSSHRELLLEQQGQLDATCMMQLVKYSKHIIPFTLPLACHGDQAEVADSALFSCLWATFAIHTHSNARAILAQCSYLSWFGGLEGVKTRKGLAGTLTRTVESDNE